MYQPLNSYLIAKKVEVDTTNKSGIILEVTSQLQYVVVEPPLDFTDLKGKTVVIKADNMALLLPDKQHYAINTESVVAVVI